VLILHQCSVSFNNPNRFQLRFHNNWNDSGLPFGADWWTCKRRRWFEPVVGFWCWQKF